MKKSNNASTFEIIHNPYAIDGSDNFDDIFIRWQIDVNSVKVINGTNYFRALQIVRFPYYKNGIIIALSSTMNLRIGDIIVDENENDYEIKCFEMFRFVSDIPDWYMKISFAVVTYNSEKIGEYFAKKIIC